ncbi:MAG: Holliday junction resolvase RuvX [Coriobacteriia bacterium]|nr:Holliday junction resolvase RuvX [Coriobacteriia bacterium]MCL2606285.1 Holliday junction resolvase RuvX [Coriobacteriia bacterium]
MTEQASADPEQYDSQQAGERVLALDIGEVRTGLALSGTDRLHANALQVMDTKDLCADNAGLHAVIADYQVGSLVVGLPLLADGSEGSQARRTRSLAAKMLQGVDTLVHGGQQLPIIFFSERQSSSQARQLGHSMNLSERDMRGTLDSFAAAIFLQEYLDTIDSPLGKK